MVRRRVVFSGTGCVLLVPLILITLSVWPWPDSDLTNSTGMRFRCIPAGEFQMGARPDDEGAEPDERPQHRVVLSRSFLLGQFEVSQGEYRRVMGRNPSWFRAGEDGQKRLGWWTDPDDLPVEMVSWYDAVEFCERLTSLTEEVAAGRRYRLPTEAEWEYACRAGTVTRFSFGNQFRAAAANMDKVHDHPLPRGSYPPNAFGLFDMHGNVLEWCSDWHSPEYYARSPVTDPRGPEHPDADDHVLRGGGWAFPAASCAFRDRISTLLKGASHGFRVVCEVQLL